MGFVSRPYTDEASPLFMAITKDIGYVGVMKETRFGNYLPHPDIKEFFKFAGIKAFRTGHWAYNHFHFSTQVPMRTQYLCSTEVILADEYLDNTTVIEQAEDLTIFDRFNELEYIFVDCLINHDRIHSDGYFDTTEKLLRGIVKQMTEVAKSFPMDLDKVWDAVLKEKPDLAKYKF